MITVWGGVYIVEEDGREGGKKKKGRYYPG